MLAQTPEFNIEAPTGIALPMNARAEVVVPPAQTSFLGQTALGMLRKVFKTVDFRGKVRDPHFTVYLRSEFVKIEGKPGIKIFAKLSLGNGTRLGEYHAEGPVNSNSLNRLLFSDRRLSDDQAVVLALIETMQQTYQRLIYTLLDDRTVARIFRDGPKETYTRKTDALSTDVESQYKELTNAVVTINTLENKGLGMATTPLGTGFFINDTGLLLSNNHVIKGKKVIILKLSGNREVPAKVVAQDEWMDIALLQAKISQTPYLKVDLQFSHYKIGDEVLAIGTPYGASDTISKGIISSVRVINGFRFVQTDAAVNQGNSGGPMIHLKSRKVIGINSFILSDSGGSTGVNFALSLQTIKDFFKEQEKLLSVNAEGKIRLTHPVLVEDIRQQERNARLEATKQSPGDRRYTSESAPYSGDGRGPGGKYIVAIFSDHSQSTNKASFQTVVGMSTAIANLIEYTIGSLNSRNQVHFKIVGNRARPLIFEASPYKQSRLLCANERVNGIFTVFSENQTGAGGARNGEFSYFDCTTQQKVNYSSSLIQERGETVPYGQNTANAFRLFMNSHVARLSTHAPPKQPTLRQKTDKELESTVTD